MSTLFIIILILITAIPIISFFSFLYKKLLQYFSKQKQQHLYTIEDKYHIEKEYTQNEINSILDKISKKGIESLNKKEKEILDAYSKSI